MPINPMSPDETADEREVRVWFSSRAQEPEFLKQMAALANDLLKVRKALDSGAKVKQIGDDVVLWNRDEKTTVSAKRWAYFRDRGYISQTTPPRMSPGGNRMLKLYAYLIKQAQDAKLASTPTL